MKFINRNHHARVANLFWLVLFNMVFYIECIQFRRDSHDIIIKFSERMFNKLEKENLEIFKNKIVNNLQVRYKAISIPEKNISQVNITNTNNSIKIIKNNSDYIITKNNSDGLNSHFKNMNFRIDQNRNISTKADNQTNTGSSKRFYDTYISNNFNDFIVSERNVKFYISLQNECNVLVNDTVMYKQNNSDIDSIEHLILNNNVDFINPKGVFSNEVDINLFAFNKKMNIFTVFLDRIQNKSVYSLEYDYMAINMIKSKKSQNKSLSNNTFLWKFYNENMNNINQKLNIEFYFSIDKLFEMENVTFFTNKNEMNLTKEMIINKSNGVSQRFVKYYFSIELASKETLVLNAKFPMYLENCGVISIDLPMIIVGSIFIIFFIFVLYIMLSQILKVDEY